MRSMRAQELSLASADAGNTLSDSNVMATYGSLIKVLNQANLAYLYFA